MGVPLLLIPSFPHHGSTAIYPDTPPVLRPGAQTHGSAGRRRGGRARFAVAAPTRPPSLFLLFHVLRILLVVRLFRNVLELGSTKTRAVDMIVSGGSSLLSHVHALPPARVSSPALPSLRRLDSADPAEAPLQPQSSPSSPPPAPRSTTSPPPKPPPTASRGGAQAALLVIDAARVDARDSGMERTGPIHPHPESDSVSRDDDATTAGDDGGGTHMVFFERAALGSARDGHPQFSIATSISAGPCHSSRAAASSASHLSAVAGPLVGRGADFAGFDFDRGARC
ncbi:hypothetical protein DFH09DRAFT_1377826 [Mycena vulgaris]|nr:hypothetical protein DFH09DRAFT_1377826 [Mycena vulgaris]